MNSLQRNYRLSLMRKTGKECYDKEFSRRFMKKKKKKDKIISAERDAVSLWTLSSLSTPVLKLLMTQ